MANFLTTLRGTLSTNVLGEIFSHSLAIVSASSAGVVAQEVHDAWQAAWVAPVPPLQGEFPGTVTYTEATAAPILGLADGRLGAATHVPFSPVLVGTQGSNSLPSQNAVAISLRAGLRSNGTPMRGRFYLPPLPAGRLDLDGLMTSGSVQTIADCVAQFISTLQASGHTPCVWSRTEARLASLDGIRVGNKVDTIRRRRNHFPEAYQDRLDLVP